MPQTVTIIGGGFGGVYTARHLLRRGLNVRLISRDDFFTFTPLLHEVATGTLEARDVSFPFTSFFPKSNFEFVTGEVAKLEAETKTLILRDGSSLMYDILVIASGAGSNFYGIAGAAERLTLKSVADALTIKKTLEEYCHNRPFRLSVLGGGFTGVELACEISQLLARYKRQDCRVMLVNDRGTPFERSQPRLAGYIEKTLRKLKIEFKSHFHAERITATEIISPSETIPSDITIVTTGVKPNTGFLPQDWLDAKGNVVVDAYLRVAKALDVFALGDIIAWPDRKPPALAQTAVQQASIVAANIVRSSAGKSLKQYRLRLKGVLVSLGTWNATGTIFGVMIKGVIAWYIWRTVYLFKTPGLKNKLRIAYRWTLYLFVKRRHFRV